MILGCLNFVQIVIALIDNVLSTISFNKRGILNSNWLMSVMLTSSIKMIINFNSPVACSWHYSSSIFLKEWLIYSRSRMTMHPLILLRGLLLSSRESREIVFFIITISFRFIFNNNWVVLLNPIFLVVDVVLILVVSWFAHFIVNFFNNHRKGIHWILMLLLGTISFTRVFYTWWKICKMRFRIHFFKWPSFSVLRFW